MIQKILLVFSILVGSTSYATVDISTALKTYVDRCGGTGASACVINGDTVEFFSYGTKSIRGKNISEDTVFEIGSITKVFTTLILMDQVAQGEMGLDDPIEMYLPGVKIPKMQGKKITLRHLATHTSGLPRMPENFHPKDPVSPYTDYSIENLYDFLNQCTLQTVPGESFEYSNVGMGLLGHILSFHAKTSYEELLQRVVLDKLGMKDTKIAFTSDEKQRLATGYDQGVPTSYWDFMPSIEGAGALRSTARDLAQFLAANMGLVNSPVSDLLRQCHQPLFTLSSDSGVGLGWILSSPAGQSTIISHNGATGGFRSFLGFNLKTKKGIVILTNSTRDWPDELGMRVLSADSQ